MGGVVEWIDKAFNKYIIEPLKAPLGWLEDLVPDYDDYDYGDSPTYGSDQVLNVITEGVPVARCYGICKIGANKIRFNDPDASDLRVIFALCVGEISAISALYINDIVWAELTGSHTKTEYKGTRTQIPSTQFTDKSSAYRSIAYVRASFEKDDSQIGSNPHLTVHIQALLCTPLAGGAKSFTRCPAVVLYDWYIEVEGYSAGDIDLNSFKSLEALCNEVPTGSTYNRYKFDFSFDTDISINDAKKVIWSSFNGRTIMSQGKIKCVWNSAQMEDGSGGLTSRTVSHAFTVDNIVKDSLKWHQPERPNLVRIHYLDSTDEYKKTSVEVKDDRDINLNGEILHEEECWFITLEEIAARRAQYKFDKFKYTPFKASLSALSGAGDLEVYDLVTITHTLPGWTNEEFMVTQKGEDQYGRLKFVLESYNSGIYEDWKPTLQDSFAPDLPPPFAVPYEIPVVDITLAEAASQTFHWSPAVDVTFVQPTSDPFWSYVEVWISTDDVTFTFYGITSNGDGFTIETTGAMFQPGATLYVKLLSVSERGVKDALTNITSKSIVLSSVIRLGNFYTHANTFGNNSVEADATILLDSANTWIRVGASGSDHVLIDGDYSGEPALRSSNYVTGDAGAGFLLKSDLLEVGNIACRGIFRAGVFQKDVLSAVGGNISIGKGADVLTVDMTADDSTNVYGTAKYGVDIYGDSVRLQIEGNVSFAVGDILRIKDGSDDEWFEVVNIGSAPTYYVARDKAGQYGADANPAWKLGAAVVNYGQSGDGAVDLTASESNAPYIGVVTHTGSPWTSRSTKVRLGNLNGFLGYTSDLYGIAIGETDAYLKYDPTNGLRIRGTIAIESMYSLPSDEDLVGYWSLDDGSGTKSVDNTGNDLTGTLNGNPQWADGISGKCLDFDGTGDYVSVTDADSLDLTGTFTISAWVKTADVTQSLKYIVCKRGATPDSGYFLRTADGTGEVAFWISVGNTFFGAKAGPLTNNTWHHVVGVYTGSQIIAYLDGVAGTPASKSGSVDINAVDLTIGGTGNFFTGLIDEIRIYDCVLTASEIKALYLYPSGNKSSAISGGQTPWASGSDVTKIDGGNIYTDTITATHINGGGFGTLTITSGKIAINTTDALEIQASGNVKVLAGADIELIGSDSDPGNLFFAGTSYSVKCGSNAAGTQFYISPETDNVTTINIGKLAPWGSSEYAATVNLMSHYKVAAEAFYDANNSMSIETISVSGNSRVNFSATVASVTSTIRLSKTSTVNYFGGTVDKAWDLGLASYAWNDAYADDWHNVADFYHLDSRDDLAAIKAIKGSGIMSDVTGLELIDDDTIPQWMLSRRKKDGEDIDADGRVVDAWEKGDVMRDADGKPYLSMKLMLSLLMGAVRQLDDKIE